MELNSKRARFYFFVILTQTHIFVSYMTLYLNHSQIHYLSPLAEYGRKYNPRIERVYLQNLLLNFLNVSLPHIILPSRSRLRSRKESGHKIARQEVEGFTQLLKIYISSVKDAELFEKKCFDSLTLLSWYIHRFWKSLLQPISQLQN